MTSPEQLLARAGLWHWVARAFWYPEGDSREMLTDVSTKDTLGRACAAPGSGALLTALAGCWEGVDALDGGSFGLAEEHTFLFGRHVRVSAHEASYVLRPGADRARFLAELGGFYAAFGFQVSTARPEMPDHLSAECEFVAALLAKEAYAIAEGWTGRARLTRRARQKFVSEHPSCWLPAFAERLAQHARLPFYPAVARLGVELLALEPSARVAATTAGGGSGLDFGWDRLPWGCQAGNGTPADDLLTTPLGPPVSGSGGKP